GLDFANFKNVAITGMKYYDQDGNGIFGNSTSEPAINGWTINIYKDNGDGVFNPTTDTLTSTTTDNDGSYSLSFRAATYFLREALPANWTATQGKNGYTVTIGGSDIQSGGTSSGNDFGNYKTRSVTGGLTLGFWSNQNGQKLMTGTTTGNTLRDNVQNLLR